MATVEGRERLRRALADHRTRTGTTWEVIGSTLRGWIENGVPTDPQPKTLLAADKLIGWPPGTAAAVIDGVDPPGVVDSEATKRLAAAREIMRGFRALLDELDRLLGAGE